MLSDMFSVVILFRFALRSVFRGLSMDGIGRFEYVEDGVKLIFVFGFGPRGGWVDVC